MRETWERMMIEVYANLSEVIGNVIDKNEKASACS